LKKNVVFKVKADAPAVSGVGFLGLGVTPGFTNVGFMGYAEVHKMWRAST
jgi:hypothetical protein